MDAIGETALVLTGKRDYFWLKVHTAPVHSPRMEPEKRSNE